LSRVYQVNVMRRTQLGPYLGAHMVQACLKQAASRLGIFSDMKGTKGDLSEGGRVRAVGISARDLRDDRIYLIDPDEDLPAETRWGQFQGNVRTPQGGKSIQHHSEYVGAGVRFEFVLEFVNGNGLKAEDVRDLLALAMICGLGSCRSLGHGHYRIDQAEINIVARPQRAKKATAKPELVASAAS